jgi:hypothetical protein
MDSHMFDGIATLAYIGLGAIFVTLVAGFIGCGYGLFLIAKALL